MLVLLVSLITNGELVQAHTHHHGFGWGSGLGSGSGCHDCEQITVCTTDGETLPSYCMAECKGQDVQCEGECPCECPTDEYEELGEGCFDENHQLIKGCVCFAGCKACGFYAEPIDEDDCLACDDGYTFEELWGEPDWCGGESPPSGKCHMDTPEPTAEPTIEFAPTDEPSYEPTYEPTEETFLPTMTPTKEETRMPSMAPTKLETMMPSMPPSDEPTEEITPMPTASPVVMPTETCVGSVGKFAICKDASMEAEACCPEDQACYSKTPTEKRCRPACPGTWSCADETPAPSMPPTPPVTAEPTQPPSDAETPMPTPSPVVSGDCANKFQVCKDVDMPEVCCPEGQLCYAKNADQSLCRPKCPGTWLCASQKDTPEPTEAPTEEPGCEVTCEAEIQPSKEQMEACVQSKMDTYSHSLIQRTGSAKTDEPVTYVWSQAGESCHQACIDSAGEAKDLYCFSDAMFGSTFDITGQMDKFCGVTDEIACIKPPKTQSPSKSTRAPFRRERDGKCFRTGTAKGLHDCTWTQAGARRFCGCLAYEHVPKAHLNEQPAGRTPENPVGWSRVSGDSCDRFCDFAGLTCSVDKLNDVRGVYDMLDLLDLVEDQIDGARCKIWDARFSKAQAPKYRAKDGYCTVAPMENDDAKASCATKQTGDDFRLCYCE